MSLSDLNNKLYGSRDEDSLKKKEDVSNPQASNPESTTQNSFSYESSWGKGEKDLVEKGKKKFKIVLLSILGFFLLIVAVIAFIMIRKNAFQEERVTVIFEGPIEVRGGDKAVYALKIRNNNRTKLKNVELFLNYSENFNLKQEDNPELIMSNNSNSKIIVGEISGQQEKIISVSGKFFAPQDSTIYINAKLTYSPGNYSNKYERDSQIGVKTVSSSIFTEITAPISAMDGDPVAYIFDYQNSGNETFADAQIAAIYANGFEFVSAEPMPSQGNNVWKLGDLLAGKKGKIIIHGNLRGAKNESKSIQAIIGKTGSDGKILMYNRTEKITALSTSPLSIAQEVSGDNERTINPGETLEYSIKLKNNGELSLKDLVVSMELKSKVLDYSKIRTEDGYYDSKDSTITWRYSEIPGLANLIAGAEQEVRLSVPVLKLIPVANENDRNYTISSVVKADTPSLLDPRGDNKVLTSPKIDIKLNSKILLDVRAYYNDLNIENFGPVPVKQGEETSFALKWEITNVSNNLTGARVSATIPSGVKWTGRIYPTGEKISYDERTNEIFWNAGDISAGRGVLGPKKSVTFQVSVIPQSNQSLGNIKLLNFSKLTAKDDFTGKELISEQKEKATGDMDERFTNSE